MSTYGDTLLAARFAALAPEPLPGDWADIVGRVGAGAARKGRRRLEVPRAFRRRRLLVVLAVVALVAVISASALAVRAFFIDKGFIGIPPLGATPSAPTRGELVLSAYGVTQNSRNKVWVYRDGRIIWQRNARHPSGANNGSTGFLEQRLTPRGVALLRSEVVSTGLFARNRELEMARPVPFFNYIDVRNGGRLGRVVWHQDPPYKNEHAYPLATRAEATALQRLIARVTEPESWLPASAWKDREIRAYVPSRYSITYEATSKTMAASRILSMLPAPARELLRSTDRKRVRAFHSTWSPGRSIKWAPYYSYVSELPTDDARALADALDRAGLEVDWVAEAQVLSYRFDVRAPAGTTVRITFEPILPHGEAICSACG
jgi:hypothetical protein